MAGPSGRGPVFAGSEDLLGYFNVRHSTSGDLAAGFFVNQAVKNLKGELSSRHASSEEILGGFWSPGHVTDLLAGFIVRQPESTEVLGELVVHRSGLATQGVTASVLRDMSILV